MEELLKQIGITQEGEYTDDGCYVVDIADDTEYGKIYSKLDKSDLVDEDEDSSQITMDTSSIQYIGDDYSLTLLGDFEGEVYKLTIREN